jgi:hypothetical protein
MQILNIPNLGREVSCYDMLFDLQYRVYKYVFPVTTHGYRPSFKYGPILNFRTLF